MKPVSKYLSVRGGYKDCEEALDLAISAPSGVRMTFRDENEAKRFRARCYKFREYQRDHTKLIYAPDEPEFGISVYDYFEISVDGPVLTIVRRTIPEIEII
jgi:hypothetical protein